MAYALRIVSQNQTPLLAQLSAALGDIRLKIIPIIFSVIFLVSHSAYGCSVPRSGSEYDSLIKVVNLGNNIFKATIPREAHGLKYGAHISVGYYKELSEYRMSEYSKQVHAKEKGDSYVATFNLAKIEKYIPFVEVYWQPKMGGMCGAFGKSHDLVLE